MSFYIYLLLIKQFIIYYLFLNLNHNTYIYFYIFNNWVLYYIISIKRYLFVNKLNFINIDLYFIFIINYY